MEVTNRSYSSKKMTLRSIFVEKLKIPLVVSDARSAQAAVVKKVDVPKEDGRQRRKGTYFCTMDN